MRLKVNLIFIDILEKSTANLRKLINNINNMNTQNNKLQLTQVFVQDPIDKGFTAYIAEFPEIIAEGSTEEDATTNLWAALKFLFEFKHDEAQQEVSSLGGKAVYKSLELSFY